MSSKPRGIGLARFALTRLLTQVSPLRAISPILRRYDAPVRVFGLLLLFTAITVVLFLAFSGTAGEVGALTDSAATSIAVEAEVINFMSGESPANVPENWPASHSTSTSSGRPCGYPARGSATYSGYPTSGVTISGSAWIFGTGTGISAPIAGCGGVSVSGAGISYTFTHHPSGDTRGGSAGASCSGSTRFTCRIGRVSRPTTAVEGEYWYLSRWSISCPRVSYAGHSTSVTCRRPAPPKPPPTPTRLPDPIVFTIEIASEPSSGAYAIGEEISVRASFSENIDIDTNSPPSLRLSLDSAVKEMGYDRLDDSRDLYFKYVVTEGDLDETGVAIPENPVTGRVRSGTGERRLLHTGLQSDPDHRVDGVRPRITGMAFDPNAYIASADAPQKIDLTVDWSEAVRISGAPSIGMIVNGAAATSTYVAPADIDESPLRLQTRFSHPQVAGTTGTTTVAVAAGRVLLDSSETIRDAAGNDAVLDHPALPAIGMTPLDRTGPILRSLSVSDGQGNAQGWSRLCKLDLRPFYDLKCFRTAANGSTMWVRAVFNETLAGNPIPGASLNIRVGSSDVPISGALHQDNTLFFRYRVASGHEDVDGISIAAGTITCPNCTDAEGNPATLGHLGLPTQPRRKVDGVPPTITGLTVLSEGEGREGWYGVGDTLRIGMEFSEPVYVGSYREEHVGPVRRARFVPNLGGMPVLPLVLDTPSAPTTVLEYHPAHDITAIHDFRYSVREGDYDLTGISVEANSLQRTKVGSGDDLKVNNRETIIYDRAYNHVCDFQNSESENWHVYLGAFSVGDPTEQFERCLAGDKHPALAVQTEHRIDGLRPELESLEVLDLPQDDDGYAIGDEIRIGATFSERVWVSGGPVLYLQVGDDPRAMTYYPLTGTDGSGTLEYLPSTEITFVYVVEEGDEDTDGLSIPENALNRMGTVIDDVARNEVLDSGIVNAATGDDHTRRVDGVRATITDARFISDPSATSTAADTYVAGDEIAVELTFSEPVDTFPDGALMDLEFTLADSTTVTRQLQADGVTSTSTVVFRYTVTEQDQGTGLRIPADPFGTPVPDLLDQVTATTTLIDLLGTSTAALNIVDKVGLVNIEGE